MELDLEDLQEEAKIVDELARTRKNLEIARKMQILQMISGKRVDIHKNIEEYIVEYRKFF